MIFHRIVKFSCKDLWSSRLLYKTWSTSKLNGVAQRSSIWVLSVSKDEDRTTPWASVPVKISCSWFIFISFLVFNQNLLSFNFGPLLLILSACISVCLHLIYSPHGVVENSSNTSLGLLSWRLNKPCSLRPTCISPHTLVAFHCSSMLDISV